MSNTSSPIQPWFTQSNRSVSHTTPRDSAEKMRGSRGRGAGTIFFLGGGAKV